MNGRSSTDDDDTQFDRTGEHSLFLSPDGLPHLLPVDEPVHLRVCGYAYVRRADGCVLFVRPRWQPRLELPGGGIKLPESMEEGLQRETFEETGYRVHRRAESPLYVFEGNVYLPRKKGYYRVYSHVYPCVPDDGEDLFQERPFFDTDEILEVCWASISALTRDDVHPTHHGLFSIFDPFDNLD